MDEPDSEEHRASPSRGRVPTAAQASTLHAQVEAVLRVLHSARADAERTPSLPRDRLVEKYAPLLEDAMLALGNALGDFLDDSDSPADLRSVRANFLEPIMALSRGLPVYQRAEEWRENKDKTTELHELVLQGRLVGFDPETRLLDYFYQNTIYARSLRTRVPAMARLLREEVRSRWGDRRELRMLVVGANSVINLASQFQDDTVTGPFYVLVADGDTQALRQARLRLEETLGFRPDVLRVKPDALAKSPGGIGLPFDIVYTLLEYDMCSPDAALSLTRGLADLLGPGGVLIAAGFLPTVPRGYHALAIGFGDLNWTYWDEARWLNLLGELPFDVSASRFELVPPANIAVVARRNGPGQRV